MWGMGGPRRISFSFPCHPGRPAGPIWDPGEGGAGAERRSRLCDRCAALAGMTRGFLGPGHLLRKFRDDGGKGSGCWIGRALVHRCRLSPPTRCAMVCSGRLQGKR